MKLKYRFIAVRIVSSQYYLDRPEMATENFATHNIGYKITRIQNYSSIVIFQYLKSVYY